MTTPRKHPIREAERYLSNARQILSEKAGKDGSYYSDPKYVKMAGDTAWKGVLIALDSALPVRKNLKQGQRPDIKNYLDAVGKKDKKMPRILKVAYDSLHLYMGYDGVLSYKIVQDSLEQGKNMINWAAKYYKQQ